MKHTQSTEFTQGALLTFLTDPAQLSLVCHFLVCNHDEAAPSPDTNKNSLQHLLLSEPELVSKHQKYPQLKTGFPLLETAVASSSDSLKHIITLLF